MAREVTDDEVLDVIRAAGREVRIAHVARALGLTPGDAGKLLNDLADPRAADSAAERADGVPVAIRPEVEDERIVVCVLLGNHWDLVYWNWRYGYTVATFTNARGRASFATDLERRSVASPALARTCYGAAIISVASTNPR